MRVLKYLWSEVVLSACHLINKMSSVLEGKFPFSYLYPNKSVFFMTPRVFDCTYFVQDLSPELDKLFPRSIKCVFVGYFRTHKRYWCYNPSTEKYFVYVDVTFFESISYFSPHVPITASKTIPHSQSVPLRAPASTNYLPVLSVDTSKPSDSTPIRDFRYVYTHHQKVPASTSSGQPLSNRWSSSSTISISLWSWCFHCPSKR